MRKIVAIGGGDTVKMMEIGRSKKIDEYLKKAYLLKSFNGIVNKKELNKFHFSPLAEIL